jgi:hypothetical protein
LKYPKENTNYNLDPVRMCPNAAKTKIYFSNIAETSAEIHIFNVVEKQIFHRATISKNSMDISFSTAGNNIVKRATEGKSKKQKLVIQYYL